MEGLSFPPSHSHHFYLAPLCRLRFFFLVIALSISWLASSCGACKEFKCGEYEFQYPFGARNSGCGDPELQLDCDKVQRPLLNISGRQYYIKSPKYYLTPFHNDRITVIEKNLWDADTCNPLSSNYTAEAWSSTQFHIEDGYKNLTLWGGCDAGYKDFPAVSARLQCNSTWHFNLTTDLNPLKSCKSQVVLPVDKSVVLPVDESIIAPDQIRELKIIWNLGSNCTDCELSRGICGYDNLMRFRCDCSGTWHPNKCPAHNSKNKTVVIIGVVIVTAALLFIAVLVVVFYRKRLVSSSSQKPHLSNVEKFLDEFVHKMPARYSYSQLNNITGNFRHKLGEGGFGVVYKGKLPTGNLVAVKMLDRSRHCENQFINEVATIGRIHHVHLIRLTGYCYEGITSALVYEYMANGSLEKFIFAERGKEQTVNWEQLYSIALGAARGIAYLHQDCDSRIIHCDIKPHNILLDAEFTPKVADFGLAKLCGKEDDHISMTAARGTPVYVAPEMWSKNLGPVTDKSDVYSFGMMLLEIVGGRKNIDVQVSRSSQFYYPEWAFKLLENGQLERRLVDRNENAEIECEEREKAMRLAKVGLWCIQYNWADRPCMSKVVQMLDGNGNDVTNPPLPFKPSIRPALPTYSTEESSS